MVCILGEFSCYITAVEPIYLSYQMPHFSMQIVYSCKNDKRCITIQSKLKLAHD